MLPSIEQDYNRHIDPIEDLPEDETLDSPEGKSTITHNSDGSITYEEEKTEVSVETDFQENLAESMEESDLNRIAIDLLDLIDKDKEAREARDKQYAEGIKRTGLGNEAPGGADFQGASKAVHPLLAEGCVDFAARAIKEIFPPQGPCKTKIVGKASDDKIAKAERKKQYMNWQLTCQIPEYRSENEQMLTQLPLGGSQYLKLWYDPSLKRPRVEFLPIDDVYLPFSVSHFYSSHRTTHKQHITRQCFEQRIESGLYRDIKVIDPGFLDEYESQAAKATDKIEGKEDASYNEDGLRTIFEIYVDYDINDDNRTDRVAPYIITIDESSRKTLAIYRNWKEDDERQKKLDWIVDYNFIPWRGAYAIGLPHLIGSLSGALTGALRALLDSAHIQTAPSLVKLKGGRSNGSTTSVEIGQINEIDNVAGADDIRKLLMPMPYNQPSPVLFQLLDWITNQAKGVVGTAEERIADAGNNMPMGTALALIEQGSITYSAIHARLHASQMKVLEILHRLNAEWMDDEETIEELGSLVVSKRDFEGPMDIIPVSDPNIFSDAQRFAQLNAVMQLAEKNPGMYKQDKLNRRALALLNFPDPEDVLNAPPEPEWMDAITENVTAALGKQPIKVYEDQDDHSHMMVHMHYLTSPIFVQNPMMAGVIQPMLAHVKEHMIYYYKKNEQASLSAYKDITGQESEQQHIQAAAIADSKMAQDLAPIMQMIAQVQQFMQSLPPPSPQLDPQSQVAKDVGMAGIQSNEKVQMAKLQSDQASEAQKAQMEAQKLQIQNQKDAIDAQQEARATELAAQTEVMDIQERQRTAITTNNQDNQTEMLIEGMREQATDQLNQQNNAHDLINTIHEAQSNQVEAKHVDINPMLEMLQAHSAILPQMMEAIRALSESHIETNKNLAKLARPKKLVYDEKTGRPIEARYVDEGE